MSTTTSRYAFAVALLHLLAATVAAQPIVNPTALAFTVSTDHDAVDAAGQPLLTGYNLQFLLPGAPQPFQSEWIGKPTPDATGRVSVSFADLASRPSPGLLSELRVAAVGLGGANASAPSDAFVFGDVNPPSPPPCAVTIAPSSAQALSAEAQAGSLTVTSPPGCGWTTASTVSWITVTAATGSGSGWVSLIVDANTANAPRTGTVSVGAQAWQVTQAGASTAACTQELSPTSALLEASAGTGVLSVASAPECHWTASSAVDWLTITATTGSGVGWVSYRFESNPLDVARTASVTVAGQTVEIMQAGATAGAPAACAVDVSPSSAFLAAAGGGGVLTVTGPPNCLWSVSSDQAWLIVTAATGQGAGWVSYRFEDYPSGSPRMATLRVGTSAVQLTQLGATEVSCAVDLSAASLQLDGADGVDSISVSAPPGCTWSAESSASWLTITATTGVGSGWASYRVESNMTGSERTSIVTIGDRAIRMIQRPFGAPR